MELSQSDERFLVPDSEDEELNDCEAWDLIIGLKALAAAKRQLHADYQISMDDDKKKSPQKKQQSIFPSCDSEDNTMGPQSALVYDTISSSDGGSGSLKDKHNVTVIERITFQRSHESERERRETVSTPSEHIGSLQFSQQAMLVPETMESLSETGPSLHMSQTGPFIVPDSPSQDIQGESVHGSNQDNIDGDDEISFNPRLLSTLASQSVDDGKGGSQGLHLRLSPSQPDSLPSTGTGDRNESASAIPDKMKDLPSTPIKNPQATLSCRKLSLKDPSPSKHQSPLTSRPSFEMPAIDASMFLEEEDKETPQKEGLNKVKTAEVGEQEKSRSVHDLGLFLDTEEEKARQAAMISLKMGESSKQVPENPLSWKEERDFRRLKRHERLQKIIGRNDEDEDVDDSNKGEKKNQQASTSNPKEKSYKVDDDMASMVFTEEQDSIAMDDQHTLSYEYIRSLAVNNEDDDDVDVIKPSLSQSGDQKHSMIQATPSQSDGDFHGFEKEDEETVVRVQQGITRIDSGNVDLPEPMEAVEQVGEGDEATTSQVHAKGETEEISTGAHLKPDLSIRLSDRSTLVESTLQDPFTFLGSQSQNVADVSAQPVSDRQKKMRRIKEMKKVLKKKAPVKHNVASSSTDDDPIKRAQRSSLIERRKQKLSAKQLKKHKASSVARDKKSGICVDMPENASRSDGLMLPPVVESASKSPAGQDTLAMNVSRGSQAESKLGRKGTTVSFSDDHQFRSAASVQERQDHTQGERERKTVREVMAIVVTRETTTEVFDNKGQLLRQAVTSEVIRRTVLEPPWPSTEVHVSEQMFSPGLSPSRSTSTLTSGDLADVSSSSLSRNFSSGSKGSNPSLEVGIQSYPTPAQRIHSTDSRDPSGVMLSTHDEPYHQAGTSKAVTTATSDPGKVDLKRLSSGSNTGQDLFGTPNESMIARCDSSQGAVIVTSLHSTPVCELLPAISSHQATPNIQQAIAGGSQGLRHREITDKAETNRDPPSGLRKSQRSSVEGRSSTPVEKVVVDGGEDMEIDKTIEKEQESEKGATAKKGKTLKGDESTPSTRTKDKGKRSAQEMEAVTEKAGPSLRKKMKCKNGELEQEVKGARGGSEERAGSGVSTGFVVQGIAASSPAVAGEDPPAPSSKTNLGRDDTTPGIEETVTLTSIKSRFEIGEQVMARWNDGFFYPGILNKIQAHNQKCQVKFDDGTQKWVDAHGLLLAKELPVGQSVMVMSADGFYECGMIMKHSLQTQEDGMTKIIYHVARDDGVNQKCERGSLLLSEDQAACLLSDEDLTVSTHMAKSPIKIGDVSLDNLVEGKRKLRLSKEKSSTSSVQAKASPALEASTSGAGTEELPSARRRQQGPVATSTPTPKQMSRLTKTLTGSSGKHSKINRLGGVMSSPLAPRKSSRVRIDLFGKDLTVKPGLFKGKSFLITHIEKTEQQKAEEKKLLQDSSLDTSADDTVEEETEYHPFVKDQLSSFIKAGGGEVLDSFPLEEIQKSGKSNFYVIASEHQRTVKYLQGLASGLTLVSHEWILHSVAQNRLLSMKAFLLPAGISLEKKRLMEWKGACADLVGQTMMVVSTRQDFMGVWNSILKLAGCHLISKFPPRASKIDPGVDFVVTDVTCPANVIKKCHNLEVPVMSSEWIAQCLINNHLVDPNAHEQYRHDYSS